MMEDMRWLSLYLDEAMDMVGASENMRQLHRRAAKTRDILYTVRLNEVLEGNGICYQCGSSYEGTVTPDTASDIDMINASTVFSVVTHRLMAGFGLRLLVFRDDWTYPGYVKLQLLESGQPVNGDSFRSCEGWGFDGRGRVCLKPYSEDNMHGPAVMEMSECGQHLYDCVPAIKCDGIPSFAAEWVRRRRFYGWPSEQQLDQMRVMGCILVSVGFYTSPEKDIEWRLSYSLQERLLMNSLNIYQHKVYILLKLIKKDILEKELREESLSSYHCKTCVFYMAEQTPAQMWTQENLVNCLLGSLRLLLKWLRDRFCPSYFIKEQNLFEKEGFEKHIEPLQMLIDRMLQTGHEFLYMLQSDHIGEILRSRDLKIYRQLVDVNVNWFILQIRFSVIFVISDTYVYILEASSNRQDVLSLLTTKLENIQSQNKVSSYTPEETKAAICLITPWLHLHIGLEFACRAVTCTSRTEGKELMKKVDTHFRLARNTAFANVRLSQASILFRFGKFEECFQLLQKIEARWSFRVISYCNCKGGITNQPSAQQLHYYYPLIRDMSVTKLLRNYFTTCIVFLPSQSELVPPPLQYEMFKSLCTPPGSRNQTTDVWAEMDAKVYLHFMQYLVCSKLDREPHKQIARDNLASLIQHNNGCDLHHRETAYNLLGWIDLQEHRTVDAVRCFIQSWQIRPHHNAAKFHMWNVWRTLAEEQLQNCNCN